MAKRKVFLSTKSGSQLVKTVEIDFKWFPGLSISQKQKSIQSLHTAFNANSSSSVLEVSTKSTSKLGVSLSAFNLNYKSENGMVYCVESLFQGSKVFRDGGPYTELYTFSGKESKKRIKELAFDKGNLVGFQYKNETWSLYPKTAFYDWLYMRMLMENQDLIDALMDYNAFTDIEFNEKKSINCQAHSLALFVSIKNRGLLNVLNTKQDYLNFLRKNNKVKEDNKGQLFLGDI
jgi:hypothetical protein